MQCMHLVAKGIRSWSSLLIPNLRAYLGQHSAEPRRMFFGTAAEAQTAASVPWALGGRRWAGVPSAPSVRDSA